MAKCRGLIIVVLAAVAGCRSCKETTHVVAVDAGTPDAGGLPDQLTRIAGGFEVSSVHGARAFLQLRERPGVDAKAWGATAATAALTAALVLPAPLGERGLVFTPPAGADPARSGALAGALAMAALTGAEVRDGGTVDGALIPDGLVALPDAGTTELRVSYAELTGRNLAPPAALDPAELVLAPQLEATLAQLADKWSASELPAKSRDKLGKLHGLERLDALRAARLQLASTRTAAADPAKLVARWQTARQRFEAATIDSPLEAAHFLEIARRLVAAWANLQAPPTPPKLLTAELDLDEADALFDGAPPFAAAPLATTERFAQLAAAFLNAARVASPRTPGAPPPELLGLELAGTLATPKATIPQSLLALAAAQDAWLYVTAGVPDARSASEQELLRAAGRARRALGVTAGMVLEARRARSDSADASLHRRRATTSAHLLLQFLMNPSSL